MERLSKRDENGNAYYDFGFLNSNHWARGKHVDRLADYEDTGLEPEEINGMVFDNALDIKFGVTIDRLRELAEADRDGRCVVLPDVPQEIDNPLEPLKVMSALKSEIMKYEYRAKNRPNDISILDYTIIKALEDVLTRSAAEAALEAHHA